MSLGVSRENINIQIPINQNQIIQSEREILTSLINTCPHLPTIASAISSVDVNCPDKNLFTPLMHAVHNERIDVINLFIKMGANVNSKWGEKNWTALDLAVESGNVEIVETLLDAGATIPTWNLIKEEPFYSSIKASRMVNWKLLQELIKKRSVDFDKILIISKWYKRVKLLSHAFEISGVCQIDGKKIEFEGWQDEAASMAIAKSFQQCSLKYPDLFSKKIYSNLVTNLKLCANHNTRTSSYLLNRIKKNIPTFILTGSLDHSVCMLFWKNLLVICDRANPDRTIKIGRYDRDQLEVEDIRELQKYREKSYRHYLACLQADESPFLNQIDFETSLDEEFLEDVLAIPPQKVANCSWASVEGIVKAYMLLVELEKNDFILPVDTQEIKNAHEKTFVNWKLFFQASLLEKYVDQKTDENLFDQCLTIGLETVEKHTNVVDPRISYKMHMAAVQFFAKN